MTECKITYVSAGHVDGRVSLVTLPTASTSDYAVRPPEREFPQNAEFLLYEGVHNKYDLSYSSKAKYIEYSIPNLLEVVLAVLFAVLLSLLNETSSVWSTV